MVCLTTSELWWILPTWSMKFGFYSRCPKVSGNTSCKWSWEIRWIWRWEGADSTFFFLPLWHSGSTWPVGKKTQHFFVMLLASLGTYHLVFAFHSSQAIFQGTSSMRNSICNDSFHLSFMKFMICHNSKWPLCDFLCFFFKFLFFLHAFPNMNPPPSSLPITSLWVIPMHQLQACCILHQT